MLKRFLVAAIVAATLLVPTVTAGAHGVITSEGGSTWKASCGTLQTCIFGNGSVTSQYNHASLSITVTLQKSFDNVSYFAIAGPLSKSASGTNTISKQVSKTCGVGGTTSWYRVKVSYSFTKDGVTHARTYYRGQQQITSGC